MNKYFRLTLFKATAIILSICTVIFIYLFIKSFNLDKQSKTIIINDKSQIYNQEFNRNFILGTVQQIDSDIVGSSDRIFGWFKDGMLVSVRNSGVLSVNKESNYRQIGKIGIKGSNLEVVKINNKNVSQWAWVSPDEEKILISECDYESKNGPSFNIFMYDAKSISSVGDEDVVWCEWSDNSRYAVCIRSSKKDFIIYDAKTGEKKILNKPDEFTQINGSKISDDGKTIFFIGEYWGGKGPTSFKLCSINLDNIGFVNTIVDNIVGFDFINNRKSIVCLETSVGGAGLIVYDLSSREKIKIDNHVADYWLSKDKKRIAYNKYSSNVLYTAKIDNSEIKEITSIYKSEAFNGGNSIRLYWSNDNKKILVTQNNRESKTFPNFILNLL